MRIEGHLDLQKNRLITPSIHSEGSLPTSGINEGRLSFVDGILYICVDISEGIPAWVPISNTKESHIHYQRVASLTWNINHGLGTDTPIVAVYNSDDENFIPGTIEAVDANNVQVGLGNAITGKAVIIKQVGIGNGIASAPVYVHDQDEAIDTWIVRHNFGFKPFIQTFIDDKLALPKHIRHIDDVTAEIKFNSPTAGFARCV